MLFEVITLMHCFTLESVQKSWDKKQRVCSKLCCMLPYPFISKNIDHIARLMELPFVEHSGTLPPVLVVNIQEKTMLRLRLIQADLVTSL
uniref:Uncharacterized protein n=1 Tax=Solanum lycopersicum TaxID=4081 RepID=A0A3Q7I3V7_SOLLC